VHAFRKARSGALSGNIASTLEAMDRFEGSWRRVAVMKDLDLADSCRMRND